MIKHLVWIGSMSLSTGAAMAQSTVAADHGDSRAKVIASDEVAALLQTPVTVRIDRVSVSRAIEAVSASAKVHIAYSPLAVDTSNKLVTLTTRKTPLGRTVEHILSGTSFRLVALPGARLAITPREAASASRPRSDTSSSAQTQAVGGVVGRVLDSTTQRGIAGVTVTVVNTKLSAVSKADGSFRITGVPSGQHALLLKLLGYQSKTSVIKVEENMMGSVVVRLQQASTTLSEVVTTVTGMQRRIEIPTDVTRLDVDSLMAVAPIRSITDLLATRVPGLQVLRTSGTPGDPSRLRLRGVSSINGSNTPIVIVDGVRVYAPDGNTNSAVGRFSSGAGQGYAAPSPLDQIDPNTIATIEVFKGPSASSLYGSDAANGVIVVTTKRGVPGATRLSVTANMGTSNIPGQYPENTFRFGREFNKASQICRFNLQCEIDSIVTFQAMNDARWRPIGRAANSSVSASMSGGTSALQYSFTGSASDQQGVAKLPGIISELYQQTLAIAPPNWMRHPDRYTMLNGSNSITISVTPTMQVLMTNGISASEQQRSSLGATVAQQLLSVYVNPTLIGRFGAPVYLGNFHEKVRATSLGSRHSMSLQWQARSTIPVRIMAGLNPSIETGTAYVPAGLPESLVGLNDSTGNYSTGHTIAQMRSLSANTTIPIQVRRGILLPVSIGADYRQERIARQQLITDEVAVGVSEPTVFPNGATNGSRDNSVTATYGWFLEPRINLGSRLFVQTGMRLDGGSASGGQAGFTGYPKLGLSWVAIDRGTEEASPEGWTQQLSQMLTQLRVRAAFGKAGVEPRPTHHMRLWRDDSFSLDGGETLVRGWDGFSIGNTRLRPERASEFEGGADIDLLAQRVSLSATLYRKRQRDAIMNMRYSNSVGAPGTQYVNIGDILNTGYELTANAQVIETSLLRWNVGMLLSHRMNKLTRAEDGISEGLNGTRLIAGYPIFGFWSVPLLGYADRNGDGVLQVTEISMADSAIYRGSSEPNYNTTMNTTIAFWNSRVQLTASLDYQHAMTQYNASATSALESAANAQEATFLDQAVALASDRGQAYRGYPAHYLIQTVNVVRFQSMSIGVTLPSAITRKILMSNGTIGLQGRNLGIRSSYRGLDPNVNAYATGNGMGDYGQLPPPREWVLRVTLNR